MPALLWRVGGSRIASSFAAKAPGTVKSHGTVSQAISSPALLIKQTLESLRPRPCHVAASPRHFPRGTPLPILRACASFSSLSAAADLPTSTAQAQQRNGPYLHTPCKPEMGAGACACELGAAAARRHQCCHARQESWIRMVGLGGPVSAWRAACSCRVPVATTTAACSIDARQQSRPLAPGTASFNRRPRPVGAEAGCIAVISLLQKVFWGNKWGPSKTPYNHKITIRLTIRITIRLTIRITIRITIFWPSKTQPSKICGLLQSPVG